MVSTNVHLKEIKVPDLGNFSQVPVIELLVKPGDVIEPDASLLTLETDKATMEIPSPWGGRVKQILVQLNDKVSQGDPIVLLELSSDLTGSADPVPMVAVSIDSPQAEPAQSSPAAPVSVEIESVVSSGSSVYAGPGTRRAIREIGLDLDQMAAAIRGSGKKGRIMKSDVHHYVKHLLESKSIHGQPAASLPGNAGIHQYLGQLPALNPSSPENFSKFGPIQSESLSRIKKLSGAYLHRNSIMAPHVTQFDEADITDLEEFRKANQEMAAKQGIKLTLLGFVLKALVKALQTYPHFNASLDIQNNALILKNYYHIGVAVDTPQGLVVPVLRDVDKKSLFELAQELGAVSEKARQGQLTAQDMQGGSFSVSSLGGVGGTAFTPIINLPEVAILGISKSQIKPVYLNPNFVPRLILPLALSYDHRVIDGAEAARFTSFLSQQLADIRRILL